MKELHDKVGGEIAEDVTIYGVIEGPATIRTGTKVILYGATAGEVNIEKGAGLVIYGVNAGEIVNRGRVGLEGLDVGTIRNLDGGESDVRLPPDATITVQSE